MKLKSLLIAIAVAASSAVFAADEAAPAKTAPAAVTEAKTAEPAKPEIKMTEADVDKLLAAIPEQVATYKGGAITGNDVKAFMRPQLLSAIKQGAEFKLDQVIAFASNYARQQMVQNLLSAEAKAKGFTPDLEAAKKELETAKKENGEDNFKKLLENIGMTEKALLDKFAESSMIQAMLDSLVKIEDADAKKFYDENPAAFTTMNASHILIIFPSFKEGKEPTDEEQKTALAKIQEVQKELAAGKDFAEMAKKYSDCPSKEQGGDLGSFAPGQVYQEFEEAFKKLKPGEISAPVKSRAGYHLIKAGETKVFAFEETKADIANHLKEQQISKVAGELIEKLVKANDAKVLLTPPAPPAPPALPEK